jgi:GT2 family glycosyltransferase
MDIVIKSWNAAKYTVLAVDSIRRSTKIPHRIFIIDNGSNKRNLSLLKTIRNVHIVGLDKNYGPGIAAVRGFEKTESNWVVLMDNDVVVQKAWLEKIQNYFNDSKVGLVSPLRISSFFNYPNYESSSRLMWEKVKKAYSQPDTQLSKYLSGFNSLEDFRSAYVSWNNITNDNIIAPPGFVSSSCVVINRRIVSECGGIALPIFKKYGGEDVDLCWRLGKAGYKIIRTKDIYVHHFEHISINENKLEKEKLLKESNKLLYNMWGEEVLSMEKSLHSRFTKQEIRQKFPFINVFHQIKNHGTNKTF